MRWLTWPVASQKRCQTSSSVCNTCCCLVATAVAKLDTSSSYWFFSSDDRPFFELQLVTSVPFATCEQEEHCADCQGWCYAVWKDQEEKCSALFLWDVPKICTHQWKQPALWYHNNGLLGLYLMPGWWLFLSKTKTNRWHLLGYWYLCTKLPAL